MLFRVMWSWVAAAWLPFPLKAAGHISSVIAIPHPYARCSRYFRPAYFCSDVLDWAPGPACSEIVVVLSPFGAMDLFC